MASAVIVEDVTVAEEDATVDLRPEEVTLLDDHAPAVVIVSAIEGAHVPSLASESAGNDF